MAKESGYTKNIFFSLIISVLILLGIGFLSVKYLIPIYDLESQDIYKFMIYLLPIIIGITFIEIGSMISSKDKDKKDTYDQLPVNSYDAPFYSQLDDDPMINKISKTDTTFTPVVESSNDSINNTEFATLHQSVAYPSDLPDDLQKQLLSLDIEQASEAIDFLHSGKTLYESNIDPDLTKQLLSLSEKDAHKLLYWLSEDAILVNPDSIVTEESQTPSHLSKDVQEKLLELDNEEANKALYWLSQDAVLVDSNSIEPENEKAVELPFDEETSQAILHFSKEDAHKAVDYISKGIVEEAIPQKYAGEFDSSFETVLKNEISSAKELGYDISLVLINADGTEDKAQIDLLLANVNASCYSFENEDGSINLIFPLYTQSETEAMLDKIFNTIYHKFKYGISSLDERFDIEIQEFLNESLNNFNSK